MVTDQIASVGRRLTLSLAGFGEFVRFCAAVLRALISAPHQVGRLRLLLPQLYAIGTRSIPVLMLVGTFVGMVLAIEAYDTLRGLGQEVRMGAIINMSVVRHIGPVLAAVMIAGRVGGAVSAELGTMRVTEQIDALRVMGADPVVYLAAPRVIACVLMVPLLTIYSNIMGIYGGYLVAVGIFDISSSAYWEFSAQMVTSYDLLSGLFKSVFFGLAIGLISCHKGFTCEGGARGVGAAATSSFVSSFVAIIILNFFLAKFTNDIYSLFFSH